MASSLAAHGMVVSRSFQIGGEDAAGPEHPGDLRVGQLLVEPVVGLAADDRVDARRRAAGCPRRIPASAVTPGVAASSWARMPGSGSTGTTSKPAFKATRLSMPVPAPRSTTRSGGDPRAQVSAASGVGRADPVIVRGGRAEGEAMRVEIHAR